MGTDLGPHTEDGSPREEYQMGWISRHRPSAAFAVALLALFLAAGGATAIAGSLGSGGADSSATKKTKKLNATKVLKNNSISNKLLKKNSIKSKNICPKCVASSDIDIKHLASVPNADKAKLADNATNAAHATNADNATNAAHANNADNATNADHSKVADALSTVTRIDRFSMPIGRATITGVLNTANNRFG